MTGDAAGTTPDRSAWAYIGVGCVTTIAGFFGGGMIGVFVGWIIGHARGCVPPADSFPICDFFPYWMAGMVLGTILLPVVAITRLRQSDQSRTSTDMRRDHSGAR
jgi:hypothetical protein